MERSADAPIRRLSPADLKACAVLSVDREWPAGEHKWTLLLEAAEAYGVNDPGDGLAGAVVLGRYGPKLASVGMMLVASRYGRQGLGAAGAQALIASLARDAGGPVRVDLDPDRQDMARWAEARGLPIAGETAFMVHGPWPPPGDRHRLFCPLTVALG